MGESKQGPPALDEADRILRRFPGRLMATIRFRGYKSLREFASAMGVPRTTVMSLCTGARKPTAHTAALLSVALDVSCDWLLGFDVTPDGRERVGGGTAPGRRGPVGRRAS